MSASKSATIGSPYSVPPEPKRLPAILLAVLVHALLLAFLWIGVSWQNDTPVEVEAEVWDMKIESAAAPALPPPPPPPVAVEEPAPQPEPTPAPVPKVVEPEPVKPSAAEINLEREKRKQEQLKQERIEREKKEYEREQRELAERKVREEQKAKALAEQKLAEKKALDKKELEKKELEKKAEAEKAEKKKLADEKVAKTKAAAADKAKLEKQREEELKRMMGAAGSSGNAQQSSAPKTDAGYVGKLTAVIKSNTTYAGSTDMPGNPKVSFRVELLPTGEILSVRLVKSSGVSQFDDAVERGINKSSPLPKKKDGTVERTLVVNFSMKDLD